MKKVILILNLIIIFYIVEAQTPVNDPHWQLVWGDNFDTLNTDKWRVLDWAIHNTEPQLYLDNNVSISDGKLVITVKKATTECDINQTPVAWPACSPCVEGIDYTYTSGWIETQEDFSTQYGFIEAKIKIPHGYGFWPAFWTWRTTGATNQAEIDVFEMAGYKASTIMGTNIHEDYCNEGTIEEEAKYMQPYCKNNNPYLLWYGLDVEIPSYTEWRTYAVEWTPSKIIWYVDGKVVRNSLNPGIIDPIRIILNFAVTPWNMPNSSTPFPSEMRIDYVKVWQLNKSCNEYINATNYDFSTYDNTVKNL